MTTGFLSLRSKWIASVIVAAGFALGSQGVMAEVVTGAGPGAGPTKIKSNSSPKKKGDKHEQSIEIYSVPSATEKKTLELGSLKASDSDMSTSSPKKPDAPGNVKSPNAPLPAGLLVPAVQKAR